ncbi:hypothetical protein GQ53DRAFT_746288 [Thozetella sp. PMI_491]|nr:hypothetical protein GQ53DRAFT_746288 [Thozetella sp. PMI_491]
MTVPVERSESAITIAGVVWALHALSGIFVALRLYCKVTRSRGIWIDDIFLVVAWFLLLATAIVNTYNGTLGFGHHVGEIPVENLSVLGIVSNVSGTTSILATAASKTSFALTLLRISNDNWMKVMIWLIIISINITMNLSGLFFWVSCDPPEKAWNPQLEGTCWDTKVTVIYGIVVGAYSALCDFVLAFLPWKILLSFRMYRREKIGVAAAMSAGVLAGITGIIKCTTIPLLESGDFTFDATPLVLWGFAECTSTIIGASIPMLRPLFISQRSRSINLTNMPSFTLSLGLGKSKGTTRTGHGTEHAPEEPVQNRPGTQSTARRDDRSDRSILRQPRDGGNAGVGSETGDHGAASHDMDHTTYELQDMGHRAHT